MMTYRQKHLNFIQRVSAPRWLQGATAGVLLLCGVLSWQFIWGTQPNRQHQALIGEVGSSPEASASPLVRGVRVPRVISTSAVHSLAPGITPDSIRYYVEQTGTAISSDVRTSITTTLSDQHAPGLTSGLWLPNQERAVSISTLGGQRTYHLEDYNAHDTSPITPGATILALSPDARTIAYVLGDDQSPTLRTVGVDGVGDHAILKTRMAFTRLVWPQAAFLVATTQRPNQTGNDLVAIGVDGSLTPLLSNRENLDTVWSLDGRRVLFSYFEQGAGVRLWYRDLDMGVDVDLGVETSARKCAWHPSNDVIVCGMPTTTTFAHDISADMTATSDNVVAIDLVTGTQSTLVPADTSNPFSIIDPVITGSGDYYAFINLFDRRLYSLGL